MRRRTAVLLLAIVGTAWVASSGLFELPVRVVYNASDSVPPGWYRIDPDALPRVGDLVLVRLPSEAAQLASRRGYHELRCLGLPHAIGESLLQRVDTGWMALRQ